MTKALAILAALLISIPGFAQPEHDRLLAPIAHYPAALQSLVIRAARFPVDIIEAAHWLRVHPELRGDAAVRAAQNEPWDPGVKALLAYPQVLAWMDENLDWTRRLGEVSLTPAPQSVYAPSYAPLPPVSAPVAQPVFFYTYRPSVVVTRFVTRPAHPPAHVHPHAQPRTHRVAPRNGPHHEGRHRS